MDYAVISLKGHQYLVKEGDELIVDRMDVKQDSKIDLDQVLLAKNKEVLIGTPKLDNVSVKAKVMEHFKGDKITVVKFMRKKRYKKKKGFRPYLTKLKIEKITHGKN
jgi:large subunit ribosomal protein L21